MWVLYVETTSLKDILMTQKYNDLQIISMTKNVHSWTIYNSKNHAPIAGMAEWIMAYSHDSV